MMMDDISDKTSLLNFNRTDGSNESINNASMDVDDALKECGGYGRFQFALQLLTTYLIITTGYHFIFPYFIADDPSWKCIESNSSLFCRFNYGLVISSNNMKFNERCHLRRDEWTYTTSKFYSFTTEFDLVCEDATVAALLSSAFYIGGLFGSIINGILADAYGRKMVIVVSLFLTICLSISCAYITSILELGILRFILGSTHVAFFYTGVVYLSEFIIPKWQTLSTNIYLMSLTLSFALIDLVAYYVRDWRKLHLYASFPSIIALFFLLFVSESPRWLLVNRKQANAERLLEKIARVNGKPSVVIMLKTSHDTSEKMYSYMDLCRSPKVLLLTIAVGSLWFTVPLIYYAIAMEASNLGGDMYQAFALLAFPDIPTYFLAAYTCNRFGRRKSTLLSLFVGGVMIGSVALVPKTLPSRYTVNLILVLPAKFFIEMAFGGIYAWSIELFPTVLRSQGISICAIFERVGLLSVPFITRVLQSQNYILPFVFMFVLAIVACVIGTSLPETKDQPTRESYQDFFNSSHGDNSGFKCCKDMVTKCLTVFHCG